MQRRPPALCRRRCVGSAVTSGPNEPGAAVARRRRAVRALAMALFCFAAAAGISVIVLSFALHQQGIGEVGQSAIDLTCALVGVVMAWHQPRRR